MTVPLTVAELPHGGTRSSQVSIDSKDVEKAADVSADDVLEQFTYQDERRILRKNLDVNNVSYIKTIAQGEPTNILNELNMTTDDYAWLSTIYTIPFIIFEIPSNLLMKRFSPRHHFLRICFLWTVAATLHAAAYNKAGIYAARFFLGLFEAGLFPGIYTYFTYFYRPDEQALRICAVGLLGSFSGILSALIAYGIGYIDGKGLSGWRYMFLLEGLTGVIVCAFIWFFLPDYPDTATFLTPDERELVKRRLPPNANRAEDKAFSKTEIVATLKDPLLYAFTGVQMFSNLGTYGLQWWLPTITASFGFTTTQSAQLLNIPPAAVGINVSLFFAWLSDRTFSVPRPMYLLVSKLVTIGAFIGLTVVTNKPALYALIIVATTGANILSSVLFSWRAQTYKGATSTAFTLAFQNGLAQLSGVISPQIFRAKYAPRYTVPYTVSIVFIAVSVAATLWAWALSHEVEAETRRVARISFKEGKENNALTAVDIDAGELR
ncbi:hypothetical protein JCM10450v2_002800 [Rhodotorula kratochvilovae]